MSFQLFLIFYTILLRDCLECEQMEEQSVTSTSDISNWQGGIIDKVLVIDCLDILKDCTSALVSAQSLSKEHVLSPTYL